MFQIEDDTTFESSLSCDGELVTSHEQTQEQTRKKRKALNLPNEEKERRANEAYEILKNCTKRDDCSVFGEYVGNELRKLSPISQTYVKHLISNILFKGALGLYESQQIVTSQTPASERLSLAGGSHSPVNQNISNLNNENSNEDVLVEYRNNHGNSEQIHDDIEQLDSENEQIYVFMEQLSSENEQTCEQKILTSDNK